MVIGCDNQGVIDQMQHHRPYIPCLVKHADLLWAILNLRRQCPIHLSFLYVAGHQDDLMRFEDLPLLAQLNVQADSLAKQALHILGSQRAPPLFSHLPGLPWALSIDLQPISSNPHLAILDHMSRRSALLYWISKGHLTTQSAERVDWPLLTSALCPCSPKPFACG